MLFLTILQSVLFNTGCCRDKKYLPNRYQKLQNDTEMLRLDPPFEHSGTTMGTIWAPMSPQVDPLCIFGTLLKPFWKPVALHRAPKAIKNR